MSFWMNTLITPNNNSKLRGVLQLSTSTLKSNLHRRIITTGTGSTHHNLKLLQLHHQTQAQTRYKATATATTTSMSPKITTGPIFTVTYVSFTVVRISIYSVFTYYVTHRLNWYCTLYQFYHTYDGLTIIFLFIIKCIHVSTAPPKSKN